jgi:hypothetical protein
MDSGSGVGSGSSTLFRMTSNFVSASIWLIPCWLFFPFSACVTSWSALVITSAGVKVGCVIFRLEKYRVWHSLALFLFDVDYMASVMFRWRLYVPSVNCICCPRCLSLTPLM